MPTIPPAAAAYYLMTELVTADDAVEQYLRCQPRASDPHTVVMDWLHHRDDLVSARNAVFIRAQPLLCRGCGGRGQCGRPEDFPSPCDLCRGDGWSNTGRRHWSHAPAAVDPRVNWVA